MTARDADVNVFAVRHGETAWSLGGQQAGTTDIPLTDDGRRLAQRMRPVLARNAFALVLCSPMERARETCELAGLGDAALIDDDLMEWNYGQYEGLTTKQIQESRLAAISRRMPERREAGASGRAGGSGDSRARAADGDAVLFAHGHVLVARWIGSPAGAGQHFLLETGTLCILGFYRDVPAVRVWNGPFTS